MNIYEINQEILTELENLEIDEETGEVISTERLDELQSEFDTKCENIACYIKNITAFAAELKTEEANLAKRRKVFENKAKRLTNYLSTAMLDFGKDKIVTARAAITFRKSNVVECEDDFVHWAQEHKPELLTFKEPTPNKIAIKKYIASGETMQYVAIVEKQNLQIK